MKRRFMVPFLAAALTLGACGDGSSISGEGASRLSIRLTDAPGDLAEAQVQITQIYLQGDNGRIVLMDGGTEYIDLLTLAGGKTAELVGDAVVPSGTYSQLRFVIGGAYIKTRDGAVYATQGAATPAGGTAGSLQCPSCAQSGFKVKLPGGAVSIDSDSKVLVVDFDVSQSFGHQAGKSSKWVMHPVMHASDFQASGGISGTVKPDSGVVLPSCGGAETDLVRFVPTATAGEVIRSGVTDAAGGYRISFVEPGSYTLGQAAVGFENGDTLTFTATASPASVTIGSGAAATADYAVQAATCKARPAS